MYHKVTIVGHLGKDPEMRYTPDGTPVTTFSVASSRKWSNTDGSQGEETVWFRITVWRRQAETAAQYLQKGRLVLVEGRLTPDKATGGPRVWTGQDGTPRASFEITAENIRFLGGRTEGDSRAGVAEPDASYDGGEDLPF
ncbi:MAG: single-stranded DNA-binding protein [Anaerolineae bacterium]|nr:single-stranded DNA-binding protein [Anaerolineae bacterium]